MKLPYTARWARFIAVVALWLTSISCTLSLIDFSKLSPSSTDVPGSTPAATSPAGTGSTTPVPLAETSFSVVIPEQLKPGESLAIGLLDEVTGLALNPILYPLTSSDAQHYSAKLPLVLHSVIKYRYYRQGNVPAIENSALGTPVRYRLLSVSGPGSVSDTVAAWSDTIFNGATGKISGTVVDVETQRPIPNIQVNAAGVSTLTDSLGQYVLNGMTVGTHLLTAYALDGSYSTFQQGAVVGAGQVTMAPLSLKQAASVQVTFTVAVPTDTVSGAPVRIAGNLSQLGNTFADLNSGFSTVATRMPTLKAQPDGRFSISLRLPVGADIRYKYSLGDGFWNAEHASDETFVLRQLIVPSSDINIQDNVVTWQAGQKSGPILFDVTVPQNTPANETISIQFNPFGWTEPLPMWPLGNNRWVYKLYGPLNLLGSFHYRYCRNEQCGSADDAQTPGSTATGRSVNTSLLGENIQENISSWAWWGDNNPGTIVAVPVIPRKSAFWAGVELSPNYSPDWQAQLADAMQNVHALGSSYVVVTPRWTVASADPLNFAPLPGSDPLWADSFQMVQYGRAQNLSVAIYAAPQLLPSPSSFWQKAPRTPEWWNDWFDRYRAFALYHADLASQAGAQALILGGDSVLPSLPGGTLSDGSPSNAPSDAEARWRGILDEVHKRFSGPLLWAQPYKGGPLAAAPVFSDEFYAFYILWSAPLANGNDASVEAMANDAVSKLDNDIAPFLLNVKKGAVVAIDYPSAQGAESGCVSSGGTGCLDWVALSRPFPDLPSATLDLKGQADLYQAMLQAINQRDWVGGFISRGYYPPVPLMDKSSSIRGKMAADLLWYWYPRLLGVAK